MLGSAYLRHYTLQNWKVKVSEKLQVVKIENNYVWSEWLVMLKQTQHRYYIGKQLDIDIYKQKCLSMLIQKMYFYF